MTSASAFNTSPDYAAGDKRYPVMYWLHGLPGNEALCEEMKKLDIPYEYEVLEGIGHARDRVYDIAGLKGFAFQAESISICGQNAKK